MYIAAYTTLVRDLVQRGQTAAIRSAAFPVLIIAIACAFHTWTARNRIARARIVLRRQLGQHVILSSIAAPVLILVAYVVLDPMLNDWPPWWAAMTGALIGMTFGALMMLIEILTPFITLEDRGIFVGNMFRIPWKSIRAVTWDPEDSMVLRFEFRRQQICALVPSDQRPEVDALLNTMLSEKWRRNVICPPHSIPKQLLKRQMEAWDDVITCK